MTPQCHYRKKIEEYWLAFKGTIWDFLQSPHCATNRLQHVRSNGLCAILCKSHATHRALIMCNMSCYEALRKAENREWRKVVAWSSLVPQRSTRLRDKWSEVKWSEVSWPGERSTAKAGITPRPAAVEVDALPLDQRGDLTRRDNWAVHLLFTSKQTCCLCISIL